MAGLKDRVQKEKESRIGSPTEKTISGLTAEGASAPVRVASKKERYTVNVIFDKKHEQPIRDAADHLGLGVSTFIKMCVVERINSGR